MATVPGLMSRLSRLCASMAVRSSTPLTYELLVSCCARFAQGTVNWDQSDLKVTEYRFASRSEKTHLIGCLLRIVAESFQSAYPAGLYHGASALAPPGHNVLRMPHVPLVNSSRAIRALNPKPQPVEGCGA